MQLIGRDIITVTETSQRIALEVNQPHTLVNGGASLAAYRHLDDGQTLAGADEDALRALQSGILHPFEQVALPAGLAWIDMACPTGQSTQSRIEPGHISTGTLHDLIDAGRLKVDASGVVLTADIVEADMEQVTGEAPTSATLYDLETQLASLVGTDFATQTTLAAVLAKLSADPATQTTLAALSNANGGQSASASSGTAAGATTDNTAVTLISADASQDYHHVRVINEGSTNGFFSPDDGTTWHRLPAFTVIKMDLLISNSAIQIKRVSGGDNLSDVYASVW